MKETINLAVINQSLSIMDHFLALEPSFERDVQKQPGSSRGAQSAVSTNAHGTYTGFGGKNQFERLGQTQCLLCYLNFIKLVN